MDDVTHVRPVWKPLGFEIGVWAKQKHEGASRLWAPTKG